jgi:hypothetical protein
LILDETAKESCQPPLDGTGPFFGAGGASLSRLEKHAAIEANRGAPILRLAHARVHEAQ